MTEFLIGCGGWAYFQVPGLRSLEAYARAFNFAEVNSTFYRVPSPKLVESWRRRVPSNFEFAVRCNKVVTHKYQLEPVDETVQTLNTMIEICHVLDSEFFVLETPSKIHFSREKIDSVYNLFESVNLRRIRMVWEVRREKGEPLPPGLVTLMHDYNIIHCIDASKESPDTEPDTIYTRLFGKGQHNMYQFTDEELLDVDKKLTKKNRERVVASFHNVKMYKDAARFKLYKQTGKFPSVTGTEGQQSLGKVLMEDARFPMTKNDLVRSQGWKVIDLTKEKRVHAQQVLSKLPDRNFSNMEEVLKYTDGILGRL